jgi:hypothetical protein
MHSLFSALCICLARFLTTPLRCCARYGFGGEPLWPSARRAAPPPCGRCGAPRRFEAQLLAPLIHFFSEAPSASMPGALADALADWEWTTVMLHSCAKARACRACACVCVLVSPG